VSFICFVSFYSVQSVSSSSLHLYAASLDGPFHGRVHFWNVVADVLLSGPLEGHLQRNTTEGVFALKRNTVRSDIGRSSS